MLKLVESKPYDEEQTSAARTRIRLALSVALAAAVAEAQAAYPEADLKQSVDLATSEIQLMLDLLMKQATRRQS